jgi:hypothetical protein
MFSQVEKKRDFDSSPYPNTIEASDFIVLDINFDKNLVAFKHVFKLATVTDEMGEISQQACNCRYIGMDSIPYSGVVLGVYDLTKQEYLKIFTIYNAAYEIEDCYEYKLSLIMLDSAKQYFVDNNLDITKKHKPLELFKVDEHENCFVYNGINFKNTHDSNTDCDAPMMIIISELSTFQKGNSDSSRLIYTIFQQDFYFMAGGGCIDYIAAYEEDGNFVFLNVFNHYNRVAGLSNTETYHFSPVLNISDF